MRTYVKPHIEMEQFVLDAEYTSGTPGFGVGEDEFLAQTALIIEQMLNGGNEFAEQAMIINNDDDSSVYKFKNVEEFKEALRSSANGHHTTALAAVDNFVAIGFYGGVNIRDGGCYFGFARTQSVS